MIARRLLSSLLLVLAAIAAQAQVQYAQKVTPIHAGVLLIDSYKLGSAGSLYDANGTPFVWYNLNHESSVKPTDWNFVNPLAPTVMTQSIFNRWGSTPNGQSLSAPPPDGVGGTVASVGQKLDKGMAPYWEVSLTDATDVQLSEYDVLALNVRGSLSLTPQEREKLRGFVDQGGVLWVDVDSNTVIDPLNGIPLALDKNTVAGGTVTADLTNPLLSNPNQLTLSQVTEMEVDSTPGFRAVDPANYGTGGLTPILETLLPEFSEYQVVADDPSGALIAVARIGDGFLVVTTRGVGDALNKGLGGAGNPNNQQFFAATPALDAQSLAAGALVVNAITLGSSYHESFFGSRKKSASPVDLHAPLLRTFFAPLPLSPGNRNFVPPATYKGLFIVSGTDRIYVYDASPTADLDGDGNPDDGLPDSNLSAGLDLLWVSNTMPGPISPPTCLSVENPSGAATKDQVLVVDATGTVHSFNPFCFMQAPIPGDLSNVAENYNCAPPNGSADFDMTEDGRGPFAPTIHDGIAYISDTVSGVTGRVGRLWVMDPSTGGQVTTGPNAWVLSGASTTDFYESSGPATIGYIPVRDSSGAEDLVAYVPTRANTTNQSISAGGTAGLTSFWLGVKGERPPDTQVVGTSLQVQTRANQVGLKIYLGSGSDRFGLRVSVIRTTTGNPLTATELASLFDGTVTQGPDGVLQFGLSGTWNPDYSLRLDYRIDLGSGNLSLTSQVKRGSLFFPDVAQTRRVLGAVALAENGNIFVSVSDQAKGGAVYALREDGRGQFTLLYRYEMYDAHTISMDSAAPVQYRETFINEDPITSELSEFNGPLTNLTLTGAPAVHGGTVFATATATVGTFSLPVTVLMAFNENPAPARIPVGLLTDLFSLVQPDIARSVNLADPDAQAIASSAQFTYENSVTGGYLKMTNMMASRTGVIQNALSSSQPVILRRTGQPDVLIEPDASPGGRWSPLEWYTILEGTNTQSPPMVTGNTVFVGGNSKLPDILTGVAPASAADRGVMFAMDTDVQPLPPYAYSNSIRPWMNQVPFLTINGSAISPNPIIRWPQEVGVTSFNDWSARYYETALRPGDTAFGVAAGDGSLFTWGASTLYGFARGDLLVADEGRLVRLNASGDPKWASDTSFGPGSNAQQAVTATTRTLVRPVRAYRLSNDQVVVADPGSNRIVRLDPNGKEIRSIKSFIVDPTYLPDGFVSTESTKLNGPSDVVTYTAYVAAGQNPYSNANPLEYWVYYLIADSGNKRLIQLVDRYVADASTREVLNPVEDVNNVQQLGVLNWHSPSNYTGKQFAYNSVARVFDPVSKTFLYAGGIGNAAPTSVDLGISSANPVSNREAMGNGGIIVFNGSGTVAVSQITVPAIAQNVFYDSSSQTFSSAARAQRIKPLGAINSVTMRYVDAGGGTSTLAIMFTDSSGVYEITQPSSPGAVDPNAAWVVRWMLPREAYTAMRRDLTTNVPTTDNPRDLDAMFARRLDSGEVILANSFLGKTVGQSPFTGEVMVLDGDLDPAQDNSQPGFDFGKQNLGFSSLSIRLQLSQLQGIRNITAPVFADLR